MRRQLVPGPVVRLTVIKAKTRPGIEANATHKTNGYLFLSYLFESYFSIDYNYQ